MPPPPPTHTPSSSSSPKPPAQATVDELKAKFAAAKPALYPARQRFSLPPKAGEKRGEALKDGAKLSDYGLKTGDTLHFKDLGPQVEFFRSRRPQEMRARGGHVDGLGTPHKVKRRRGPKLSTPSPSPQNAKTHTQKQLPPKHQQHPPPISHQIGYSTVFFFEYLGPMLIYPLYYYFPQFFYPASLAPRGAGAFPPRELVQGVACAYWVGHYAKRIAETFLVHRFGHATMPISNLFKNCSYYYGFAAFVAYFVNHPLYTAAPRAVWLPCFAAAALCQLSNLYCHVLLSGLRKPGDKGYSIPRGFLFNYITCANYSAEIWGWTLFSLGTRTAAAAVFTAAGAYQMAVWAQQKHRRLQKIFDGKDGRERYPKRWIMLPPFF